MTRKWTTICALVLVGTGAALAASVFRNDSKADIRSHSSSSSHTSNSSLAVRKPKSTDKYASAVTGTLGTTQPQHEARELPGEYAAALDQLHQFLRDAEDREQDRATRVDSVERAAAQLTFVRSLARKHRLDEEYADIELVIQAMEDELVDEQESPEGGKDH